jgi:TRAP-type C4-dicarboxylate transport system permease small subunit
MRFLARGRAACDVLLSAFVIVLFAALTLDVLWGVYTRYMFEAGQARWTEELATTLLVWVSFLGAALVYGEKGHLGLDYFVGKLDPAARRLSDCIASLLVMIFAAVVLVYGGWLLVDRALDAGQLLPALGWKKAYGYAVVPISGLFFVFYAIEGAANAFTDKPAVEQGSRAVVE